MSRMLWPWVLAAMGAVTAVCTVLYLAAPFESPERIEADLGLPGLVEPEHRITAVRDDGSLVVFDERTGELSEVVRELGDGHGPGPLTVGRKHEAAFVERAGPDGEPTVSVVHLETGATEHLALGRSPAVGRLHHESLPRTRKGPEVELLAWIVHAAGGPVIAVENRTTGAVERFGASEARPAPFEEALGLAWDPFSEQLYVTARENGAVRVWRLDADRMSSLHEVEPLGPGPGGREWVGVTSLVGQLVVIERGRAGEGSLVAVEPDSGRRLGPLLDEPLGDVVWVDADHAHRRLVVVTADGTLYRWDPRSDEAPVPMADGILSAAW